MLLTPGAGSDRSHPALVAIEAAAAPMPVERVDFPYRREGRRAPDRAPKLVAAVVEAATALAERIGAPPDALVLGGRSMGGRICSMAVAEGLPAAGLVLIGYPLHPPGRPDRLRTAHLPALATPCLFVSGTRDPFATPGELEEATASVPGPVTHVWVEGGGHTLKGSDRQVASTVVTWVRALGPRG
ncbi:MAG: dienelactone hydrolase [Actinobacteria bacterium]|nr:dienelactone hydrolase [Actinomycetota bacterium]